MTENPTRRPDAPESATVAPAVPESGGPRRARLLGLDAARGLAVLGMFVAHFNPYQTFPDSLLQQAVSGRSAGLFAVLAGITTALLSGGEHPPSGRSMRERRVRIAVRAVLLFALGLALTALGTSVKEILTAYGVLFLLALPVLRWSPRALATAAAVTAIVGPLLSFWLRASYLGDDGYGETVALGDVTSLAGLGHGFLVLTVTGVYPLLTWAPFLLAGMAIGRLPLRAPSVRRMLVVAGAVLAAACYGLSALLTGPLGGFARIAADLGTTVDEAQRLATTTAGVVPTVHPLALLTVAGHSGAPLEIGGVIGIAMLVVGGALVLADRSPRLSAPLRAVGTLALTSYAAHIVVIALLGEAVLTVLLTDYLYLPLIVMIVGALVLASLWTRWIGQGPLERPVSSLCRRVAAAAVPPPADEPRHRRSS